MAASTLKGEEGAVLSTFAAVRRAHSNALLVMAPRKPERFGEAETLARAEGLRVLRRTELAVDAEPRADVVILDTIGELAHLFQVATVVFVGGSWLPRRPDILSPRTASPSFRTWRTSRRSRGFCNGPPFSSLGRELESTLLALRRPVRRASLGAAAGHSSRPIARGRASPRWRACRPNGWQREALPGRA
jgi:hypothetical protein